METNEGDRLSCEWEESVTPSLVVWKTNANWCHQLRYRLKKG